MAKNDDCKAIQAQVKKDIENILLDSTVELKIKTAGDIRETRREASILKIFRQSNLL